MIRRQIEELYGFGAARVVLRGEAIHVGDPDHALQRAAAIFVRDMRADGLRRMLTYSGAPLLGFALILLLALATMLVQPNVENSDIEIVAFEAVPPPIPLAEPEPIPPRPIPEPEPPQIAKAEPVKPPVVRPPPPVVRAEPLPEIAKPLVRTPRSEPAPRVEPKPAPRPRVQIDSVAVAPTPVAPPPKNKRRPRIEPVAERARVAVAPLDAAPLPDLAPAPEPARKRFRVAAAARPAAAPKVRVDPLPASIDLAAAEEPRQRNQPLARPTAPTRDRARRRPNLAPTRTVAPAPPKEAARVRARTTRAAPQPVDTRSRRSANVGVPQLSAPVTTRDSDTTRRRVARVEPVVAPNTGTSRSGQVEKLSGVPLGSLAACVTDRQEDALKQQVVSAVTTQKECLSGAGRYRFIQTKNLNSFLMWVDRAQGRAEADRCAELRYALDCLKRQKRTGS